MISSEIMDLTKACQSFPELPDPEIHRENILDTIDYLFDQGNHLVIVEGESGIGKTVILTQFIRRHINQAFSLFINTTSRIACDPDILRFDLCNQLEWILNQKELETMQGIDDTFLHGQIYDLKRQTRHESYPYYFVVDGLYKLTEYNSDTLQLVLEMLPLGWSGFNFLFSGDESLINNNIRTRIIYKPLPLSPFSLNQTKEFFKDFDIEPHFIEEIHRTCRKMPGNLTVVQRILKAGVKVESLIEDMSTQMPDLFDYEWSVVDDNNEMQLMALAIMAFDKRKCYQSISDLSDLLHIEETAIIDLINNLTFIEVDSEKKLISFVSEAFRRYAQQRLQHKAKEARDCIIDKLLSDSTNETSRFFLPEYLDEAERFDELLEYLSTENLIRIIEHTQSLSIVKQKANIGVRTALKLNRDGYLLRFSIQKSAMTRVDGTEIWRSEIEARMALNDYEQALALAQSTVLKEDRLHLLAVIAKSKLENGLSPEPELQEHIHQLYKQIDHNTLGSQAIDIACDLVYSNQELAIDLVEKAMGTGQDDQDLDWAFAKLSVAAQNLSDENPKIYNDVRGRISDPQALKFSIEASRILEKYSADDIISEVEKYQRKKDRINLLGRWASRNKERSDAGKVVEFAYNLIIKMSPDEYVPARDYRRIAAPLPYITDTSLAMKLVGLFDGQLGLIERLGPTEDYVKLQLLLAQTICKYDFGAAKNRIIDIYLYIGEISDLTIKATCLAQFISILADIDPKKQLEDDGEKRDQIHTTSEKDLKTCTQQLLNTTADHYQVMGKIIVALCISKQETAFELALQLNTVARRDKALIALANAIIREQINEPNLDFLYKLIENVVESSAIDTVIVKLLKLAVEEQELTESLINKLFKFIGKIDNINSTGLRCQACCLAYSFLSKNNVNTSLTQHLLSLLQKTWQSIDTGWNKIDIGFKIVSDLATHAPEIAKEFLTTTEQLRNELLLDSRINAQSYLVCIWLAIRAYSGLLAKDLDTEDDLIALTDLIDYVPSHGERASLWALLALRCYMNDKLAKCKRIVSERVRPQLDNIPKEDALFRTVVILDVASALYCAHPPTAHEFISNLSRQEKNIAYSRICLFLLRKQPFTEPYVETTDISYSVSYEDISDICDILEKMDSDPAITYFIEAISNSVIHGPRGNTFSREQVQNISSRLQMIINNQLPNKKCYVQHEGYKILAQAQIYRMKRASSMEWNDLIEKARIIPNLADKVTVLASIINVMPTRELNKRKTIINEVLATIDEIPAILDRIEHYESVAIKIKNVNLELAKNCISKAMNFALKNDDPNIYSIQRRLVDLADSIGGEDFAASFASSLDDDPARTQTNTNVRRRLEIINLRKKIANRDHGNIDLHLPPEIIYPEITWSLLGRLNAGRISHFHNDYMRNFVEISANLPLILSYPILSWVIENSIARFSRTDQAQTYIRPIFRAALAGAQIAARIATHSSDKLERAIAIGSQSAANKYGVTRAGDREKVIQFLRHWFEHSVKDYLKICDAYFGPEDLEVLKILLSVNPECKVQILTSQEHHQKIEKPWNETYQEYWRTQISNDQLPPQTDVIIIGTRAKKSPIHDRWWLTKNRGIRMGHSFHELGLGRTSEISELTQKEAESREKDVNLYLNRIEREYDGEPLQYVSFTL